jgi:hypothetical protein
MLELKHLAPYFPYGLKCEIIDSVPSLEPYEVATLKGIYSDGQCVFHDIVESQHGFHSIKPILNPLSALTEEHKKNCGYNNLEVLIDCIRSQELETKIWNDLLQNHWDVFDLIPKDLAIDINTLES